MVSMSTRKSGRPKSRKKTVAIQIRVLPEFAKAIETLAERNGHSRTLEICLQLEGSLQKAGLWPPPQGNN